MERSEPFCFREKVLLQPEALMCLPFRRCFCRNGEMCYKKGRRLLKDFYLSENFAHSRIIALQGSKSGASHHHTPMLHALC